MLSKCAEEASTCLPPSETDFLPKSNTAFRAVSHSLPQLRAQLEGPQLETAEPDGQISAPKASQVASPAKTHERGLIQKDSKQPRPSKRIFTRKSSTATTMA